MHRFILTPSSAPLTDRSASYAQAGYSLTLTLPDTDRYFDDKLDILERNGLGQSASFTLAAGMAPGEEMMGFLRLMQLSGEALAGVHCCIVLYQGFAVI